MLLLALSFFSVDRGLHRALHEDADHSNHSCFLTLLASGQVEVNSVCAPVVPSPERILAIADRPFQLPRGLDRRLPPSCGPPTV